MVPWKHLVMAAAASLTLTLGAAAHAQPALPGPIKVMVGFPAGGPPDLVARKVAQQLAQQSGTTVLAENRPGAAGTIAAAAVAHAEPDGRTLLFGVAANLAVAPATMKAPPYDPTQAFAPIVEVANGPYVLLVRADAPAGGWKEFAAWARAQPGKLNYATPGIGSVHHIATETLLQSSGLRIVHVPYRSSLYQPLLAGEVQVLLESLPGPLPYLASGKLRALAVTGPRRLKRLPDVPTFEELGVQDADASSWWGFVGPAGMPPALVARLNAEIRKALADPELAATMDSWGIELSAGSPREFADHIARENARWKAAIARMGLPLE
jgi:tripartite-type tricarboxylate transporter receptor subunit TctC